MEGEPPLWLGVGSLGVYPSVIGPKQSIYSGPKLVAQTARLTCACPKNVCQNIANINILGGVCII